MRYVAAFAGAALPLAALLAWAPATAQVYKCGKGGAPVFSDKPCADRAAEPVKVSSGPQGQLDFQVGLRHYPVTGANARAAYASMRANGPGGWAGFARWDVDYRYENKTVAGGCAITAVNVRVRGDIQMPQWLDEAQAPPADQEWWRTMYANLKRHEDGHVQHGREFALLLKERLLGIGTVPCPDLQARTRDEFNRLYGNLKRRDEEYDRRTDHGLRQDNPN